MAKKFVLVAVAIAVIGFAVLFFVDFDSPELGNTVLEKVNEATGASLSVEDFRLNLFRGLVLHGVQSTSSFPGTTVEVTVDELRLKHRLLPLLSGRMVVDRVLVRRPRVEIVERDRKQKKTAGIPRKPKREAEVEPPGEEGAVDAPSTKAIGGVELEISEIRIEEGAIRKRAVALEGLNLTLRDLSFNPRAISALHALAAVGSLELDRLRLDGTEVHAVRGELLLDQGRAQGHRLTFSTEHGNFLAELTMNFNQIPFGYTLSLRGDPIDLNAIAGSTGEDFGPGVLELEAQGLGADSEGIKGHGVLRLAEGKLPSTPVLAQLEEAWGRGTRLVGSPYQATEAPFRIDKNRLLLEELRLQTPQAGIDLEGIIDLDGPLDLAMVLRTPREDLVIEEIPDEVLDALTDEEGWVSVPFHVSGSREAPRVVPDAKTLVTREGAQRLIERGIESFLTKKKKN